MTAFKVRVGGDFAALHLPGKALPTLEAEVDDPGLPYVLQVTVRVVHGKPVCQNLAASRREGGRPVTRRGLNSLPVEQLVSEIAAAAVFNMETGPGYVAYDPITGSGERAARRQLAPPRGPQPDPAAHDVLIRRVVDAYRDLLAEGIRKPKPVIAKELSISQSYVASLLPLPNHRRSLAAPTTYRRKAARTAAAVELKYSGGSMKPHSLNAEPLVRARR
jgi:hypothetical protein